MSQLIHVTQRFRLAAAIGGALLAGSLVWAASSDPQAPAESKCEEHCLVAAKVAAQIEGWKAAAAAVKGVPEAEQARLRTELASVARECPVGSRVGETLHFVKAVLASTAQLERSAAQKCPIDASGDKAACQIKAARAHLIGGLEELVGQAAAACACPAAREAGAGSAALAEKALELLASWDRAPAEVARLPAARKEQLAAQAGAIAQRLPSVKLLPATLEALQLGFGAVDTMNGQLCDWVKAHPEICKDISEEARAAMARQVALLHATAQILVRADSAMKSCAEACTAKTETAAVK
jgi:hypothetical protein